MHAQPGMTELVYVANLACLDIYDPIEDGAFDAVFRAGETTCGLKLLGQSLHVVFQGTENIPGWIADADAIPFDHPLLGEIHSGFWKNLTSVLSSVSAWVLARNLPRSAIVSGHSKGAGEGAIFAAILSSQGWNVSCHLFACPNAGFAQLAKYLQLHVPGASYRNAPTGLEVFGDPVPLVPPSPYKAPYAHTYVCHAPPGAERLLDASWHKGGYYVAAITAMGERK